MLLKREFDERMPRILSFPFYTKEESSWLICGAIYVSITHCFLWLKALVLCLPRLLCIKPLIQDTKRLSSVYTCIFVFEIMSYVL